MIDSLILLDFEGKILTVNESLMALLGYKENEIKSISAQILFQKKRNLRKYEMK